MGQLLLLSLIGVYYTCSHLLLLVLQSLGGGGGGGGLTTLTRFASSRDNWSVVLVHTSADSAPGVSLKVVSQAPCLPAP